MNSQLLSDLDYYLERNVSLMRSFNESSILILGGSGFIGKWLVAILEHSKKKLKLSFDLMVSSRSPRDLGATYRNFLGASTQGFQVISLPDIKEPQLFRRYFHDKNMSRFFVIHAATSTSNVNPSMLSVLEPTRDLLNAFVEKSIVVNFSHLSSGAVYDRSPLDDQSVAEKHPRLSLDKCVNFYQETKVLLEELVDSHNANEAIRGINLRLFAFAGPGMRLGPDFAVTNFVEMCTKGKKIEVLGHPDTERTYLYPSELAEAIFKAISIRETVDCGPINIGSKDRVTIQDLALKVNQVFMGSGVNMSNFKNSLPTYYVPSVQKSTELLKFDQVISLRDSLQRWKQYLKFSS